MVLQIQKRKDSSALMLIEYVREVESMSRGGSSNKFLLHQGVCCSLSNCYFPGFYLCCNLQSNTRACETYINLPIFFLFQTSKMFLLHHRKVFISY
jgi:hypothetical protein